MIDNIRNAFKHNIQKLAWISEYTKKVSSEKVSVCINSFRQRFSFLYSFGPTVTVELWVQYVICLSSHLLSLCNACIVATRQVLFLHMYYSEFSLF